MPRESRDHPLVIGHSLVIGHWSLVIGYCLLLSSCTGVKPWGSERKQSDLDDLGKTIPPKWSAIPKVSPKAATGWLGDFNSQYLSSLVQQSIAHNHDLRAASARVAQARAQARIAGANLWPQIAADFNGRRNQTASGQRFVGTGQRSNRFDLGADVTWEIDFWGRIADQRGAAIAAAEAADEDLHATKLSLAANTVKAAVTLAEAQGQVRLAEENVKTRRVHLGIVERQLDRGLDAERAALDVSLSRSDLARGEATLATRKRVTDEARRNLELLLGAYPAGKESGLSTLPDLARNVPAGLPSELLLRRPDLRAAERRLEAELRDESAAKKALLPSFNLTGGAGLSTEDLTFLLEREAVVWSIAGNVAQRIFEGGRLKANIDLARARYDEALSVYAQSVLTAFKEVESALAAEAFLREQEAALQTAVTEADRSVKLAAGQYDRGLADILTLLDAQQRLFDARSLLLDVKAQRLRSRADLHLALGGGF
jgi:multidrug efflux system outer membrane protein